MHNQQYSNQQTRQVNGQSTSVSLQQLTKDLVEIFKLRVTSLFMNTLVLFWPILAAVIIYTVYPFLQVMGDFYNTVQAIVYLVLLGVFLFHSVPRIGMDRLEKRFWIKRYLTKREVATEEESRAFILSNKSRIISYRRYVFNKTYLVPLIITFAPILVAATIIAWGAATGFGGIVFAYVFLGSLIGVPLLITIFLFYWLHTRTTLMFAWERFLDAIDNNENLTNGQILQDAHRLVKVLGFKGRAKFVSYDFATSTTIGVASAAVTQVARVLPEPVERVVSTYVLLYSFNAYQLENLAIAYCFYMESKAKDSDVMNMPT